MVGTIVVHGHATPHPGPLRQLLAEVDVVDPGVEPARGQGAGYVGGGQL